MHYRTFPRTGWSVAEIGYGMWGMGDWSGSDDDESLESLNEAVRLGCNFFDTAWAYGSGHSERILGRLLKQHPGRELYVATKIPPKNLTWPARDTYPLDDVFPSDHIREYTERSLENLGLPSLHLQQFHVWTDAWADDDRWKRAVDDLKRQKLIQSFGISINRWEPTNVLRALESRLVDSVQVVYNVFDQNPERELFPHCQELGVAVIARVPFDEGSLTGTLTSESRWPQGDWRNLYFTHERLPETVGRVRRLEAILPPGMSLPELALRFVLHHPAVTTTIPGMRKLGHVRANLGASDDQALPGDLLARLREHEWVRDWVVP